ncbi:MAG: L,D-transpeptidase [Candidatus Levybacteria bacterium]|nr:L,D-transpeptidase [Candidatus Levybacteria bacterium]
MVALRVRSKKTFGSYLKLYFISLVVGLTVFATGKYFFKPDPPCANSLSCKSDLSEKIENGAVGVFAGQKVIAPKIDIALDNTKSSVLGANVANGEKHVYVDLASQTLYAYQGSKKIMQTFIASGRWGRTPTGNFNIWTKLRATRMSGGSGTDAYNLPNVPYVMYFYRDFGLHGAYWHNNFGYPMSHGCVNMRPVDAGDLFNWVDGPANGKLGTAVSVCDSFTAPNNCVQENPIN